MEIKATHVTDIDIYTIAKAHGLDGEGRLQRQFADIIVANADPYVPFDRGVLKNSVQIVNGGKTITYNTPYARYQWYGKLAVDPVTGKGAFFNPKYGFWSRKGVKKVMTNRDLKYQNNHSGLRGPFWVTRMWADKGDQIVKKLEKYLRGG